MTEENIYSAAGAGSARSNAGAPSLVKHALIVTAQGLKGASS